MLVFQIPRDLEQKRVAAGGASICMSSSSGDSGQGHRNHVSQKMGDRMRMNLRHAFLFYVCWGGLCDELKERLSGRLGGEPRKCEKVHVRKLPDHMHSTHSARCELSRRVRLFRNVTL